MHSNTYVPDPTSRVLYNKPHDKDSDLEIRGWFEYFAKKDLIVQGLERNLDLIIDDLPIQRSLGVCWDSQNKSLTF